MAEFRGDTAQDPHGLARDFRPDAIAGQDQNVQLHTSFQILRTGAPRLSLLSDASGRQCSVAAHRHPWSCLAELSVDDGQISWSAVLLRSATR